MKNDSPIDKYISNQPEINREKLNKIREIIKKIIPDAEEIISYHIPAFRFNNKNLIYFAGWKNHVSIYPIPKGDKDYQNEIKSFIAGRGTLKFSLDKNLPEEIIKKTIKFQIEENKKNNI